MRVAPSTTIMFVATDEIVRRELSGTTNVKMGKRGGVPMGVRPVVTGADLQAVWKGSAARLGGATRERWGDRGARRFGAGGYLFSIGKN